jgi:mannose-1-phosphate guanylyltransferase
MSSVRARGIVQAMVLAAGRSTRISGELEGRSKLLVNIGGETVLERNLRWLHDAGVTDVWINLHYRPNDIRALVGHGSRLGLCVRYSEEPELLGTAGAFRKIVSGDATHGSVLRESTDDREAGSQRLAEPVLVVYGDNVSRFDLQALVRRHVESEALATIALFDARVHGNSGIAGGRVVIADGLVVAFAEGRSAEGRSIDSSLVNAGVYVLQPAVADHIADDGAPDFGRDVFPTLLARGARIAAHVIEPSGYCFGIDTPEALAHARAALAERVAQ